MKSPYLYLIAVKVLTLGLLLVVVIGGIRGINKKSVEKIFGSLGIDLGTSDSPGLIPATRMQAAGESRFNICRTRISSIDLQNGVSIAEHSKGFKSEWMAQTAEAKIVLPYLDIEKWLSHACHILIKDQPEVEPNSFQQAALIRFVDGTTLSVLNSQSDQNVYRVEDSTFVSEELTANLNELRRLVLSQ